MKKIKMTFMTLAVLLSVGGAIAGRPKPLQTGLYYYNGTQYLPAGTLGVNYVCESSPNVCTYTKSGNNYTPYQTLSTYTPIRITTTPANPEPKKGK
jgi:hypothetical protein